MPVSLHDLTLRSHLIVESFLLAQGYAATAKQLRQDAAACGVHLPALSEEEESPVDIKTLVEQYASSVQAQQQEAIDRQLAATHATHSVVDPLTQSWKGPAQLPYRLTHTHKALHAANILSISECLLPRRHFDTTRATYANTVAKCVTTTAADKRIVFSNAQTGEMEEILEHKDAHQAAVLSIAQDPSDPRCLISSGMDSKVVVWDLVTRQPIQVLKDHAKFVVRIAFSSKGDYFASAAYDRKIVVYRRNIHTNFRVTSDDEQDYADLQGPRYVKVHEIETSTNPEAILFVRAAATPWEDVPTIEERGKGEVVVREARQKRTWLAYTVRSDSFLHYLALPLHADQDADWVEDALHETHLDTQQAQCEDWSVYSFNTNPNAHDLHVSYSLMALSLHPSGLYMCIQTGDHTMPNMASSNSSSSYTSSASLSRLLLLPLLSARRAATVWTGVATSSYAVPRHAWLPSGKACWLTAEDGVLRLVDLKGKTRAQIPCHGLFEEEGTSGGVEQSMGWSRGGNTIIKDVVTLDEHTVASCGFDRTVRVLSY